jgi:hypothetical protein
MADAGDRIEEEMREFVRWFNDDVVPNVRSGSGKALRVASKKLSELADYLDRNRK